MHWRTFKRIAKAAARPQIVMNNPSSIAAYYMEELRHEEQELVICMMSDVKGHFLGDKILTRGTATGSLVTPRKSSWKPCAAMQSV